MAPTNPDVDEWFAAQQVRTMRFADTADLSANRGEPEAVISAWCDSR